MKKILVGALCLGAVFGLQARTVAFWPFGAKGLTDASGNGNTLEADANVTVGETASMNGLQRLFSTVNALNLKGSPAVTVEFWTKFNAADNPGTRFFLEFTEVTNSNGGGFYIDYGEAPGAVLGMYRAAGGNSGAEEKPIVGIGDGQWHHVAFITSPSTSGEACSTLYIDKTHVYTHCHVYAIANASGYVDYPANKKLYVGSRNNSALQFKGEIDNLRVSDEALPPDLFINLDGTAPVPAPLAYWPFGSAGATDMSGNGHDFQLSGTGAAFADGALSFDGTQGDSFTRFPVDLSACTRGLTTEFWFRAPAGRTEPQIIFEVSPDANTLVRGSAAFYAILNDMGNKMHWVGRTEDDFQVDQDVATPVQDGAWHHVAYVANPTIKGVDTFRFYLDGVLQAQRQGQFAGTNLLGLAMDRIFVGTRCGAHHKFTGEIDDIRLTPAVLSPEQFMSARTSDEPAVLGHWTFNRTAETVNARGDAALVASGVTYENGAAVLDGAATLATSALTAEGAVTAECYFEADGAWHHLVKVFGDGLDAAPTATTVDGADATSPLLTFADGALRIAGTDFTGRIDDVRVTEGVLPASEGLPARTDDTPVALHHWRFDSLAGVLADSAGGNDLRPVANGSVDYSIYDRALTLLRSAGMKSSRPLHLSQWPALTIEWFARTPGESEGLYLELGTNYNNQVGRFCASAGIVNSLPGAGFRTSGGYNIRTAQAPLADGAWHRFAYVLDRTGGALRTAFYVDGVAQANYSSKYANTADTAFADDNLMVGARETTSVNPAVFGSFIGDLDEIRIVNAALDPADMMTDAVREAQANRLVAHWDFTGETPLADRSGNGYDLTGTAEVVDGMAVFSGTTAFQTVKPLAISGFRQLTVESVFQVDAPEELAILFETGTEYGANGGSVSCYYNGAGDFYGRIDAATRGLVWTTGDGCLRDTRWHHVAMEMDMDVGNQGRIRYWIDGVLSGTWTRVYNAGQVARDTTLGDLVLHLGSRNGTGCFMKGRMKEVRVTAGLVSPDRFLSRPAPEADAKHVVAYWPFTRAADWQLDESGHGYELATTGKGVVQTSKSGCVSFADGHDPLQTSTRIDFASMDRFTVEAFVRPTVSAAQDVLGTATWDEGIVSHNSHLMFATGVNAAGDVDLQGTVTLDGFRNKASRAVASTVTRGAGTYDAKDGWHHVALVVDRTAGVNGRVAYFYDHKAVFDQALGMPANFRASQLAVGSQMDDKAAFRFVGDIDDVRITAAALAPAEMLQRRSAGLGMLFIVR